MNNIKNFQKSLNTQNVDLGLKTGDLVTFMCGYNADICVTRKIIGFDNNGLTYLEWDCYWFGVDFTRRWFSKKE